MGNHGSGLATRSVVQVFHHGMHHGPVTLIAAVFSVFRDALANGSDDSTSWTHGWRHLDARKPSEHVLETSTEPGN